MIFFFSNIVQSWILTVLTNGFLDQGQVFIHFWAQLGKEHTVVLAGEASDSYFTFTQRCLLQTEREHVGVFSWKWLWKKFLLFSIIKDKSETGKKKVIFCCFVLPMWGRIHLGSGTSWTRDQLQPGARVLSFWGLISHLTAQPPLADTPCC